MSFTKQILSQSAKSFAGVNSYNPVPEGQTDNFFNGQMIIVDSQYKTSGSQSTADFTFRLADSFDRTFTYVKPLYLRCVNSWLTISSSNNTINWRSGSTDVTTTITEGIYNANDLATKITVLMTADIDGTDTNTAYTCSYNDSTGKFQIRSDSANWTLYSTGTINKIIGFSTTANRTGALIYVAPYYADLQPIKTINIETSIPLHSPTLFSATARNILMSAPVTVNSGGYISHDWEQLYLRISGSVPNTINVKIYDQNGALIDTQGCDIQFAFLLI